MNLRSIAILTVLNFHFILFDTIIYGTVLIPFFDCSLLLYINTIPFWVLFLSSPTLLNSFTSSNSCLVNSLAFSIN